APGQRVAVRVLRGRGAPRGRRWREAALRGDLVAGRRGRPPRLVADRRRPAPGRAHGLRPALRPHAPGRPRHAQGAGERGVGLRSRDAPAGAAHPGAEPAGELHRPAGRELRLHALATHQGPPQHGRRAHPRHPGRAPGARRLGVPGARVAGLLAAASLLVVYGAAIAVNLARGRWDIDCGCAGPADRRPITGWLVARNAVLAAAALAGLAPVHPRALLRVDAVTVAGATAALAACYASLDRVIAYAP